MATSYTGIRVVEVRDEIINNLYINKSLDITFNRNYRFFQNEYVVIKSNTGSNRSALTRVVGDQLCLLKLPKDLVVSGVQPRNKEQWFAFDALLDDSIKVVVLTGRAGTGKTLLALAASLHKMEEQDTPYEQIILTRPMSWLGKHSLGALPGDVDEKFGPYLENYICNISHLIKNDRRNMHDITSQYKMKFVPLQLIRGASWANAIILADEVQVLDYQEMVALGTRVGENSKIVIMGDLNQRDEKIAKEKTGIHKFINDDRAKNSPMVASLELWKCERSPISELFSEIFGV